MKLSHRNALLLSAALLTAQPIAQAANIVAWEADKSLVDTLDLSGSGSYYWFANFANPNAVTGAAADDREARNLPSWIYFETRPAFIGKDDSGVNSDSSSRTGFSFQENAAGTVGSTTIGGQTGPTTVFNTLTLPDGLTGISGEVVDTLSVTGNTSSFAQFRILPGAPDAFRLWVVTDNGTGLAYQEQARIRVSLRDTTGPPTYVGDTDVIEVEALPGGVRVGQTAIGHNGLADAWSFRFGGVGANDVVTLKSTSASTGRPAFAGFVIQPIPEPATAALLALGAVIGCECCGRRAPRR